MALKKNSRKDLKRDTKRERNITTGTTMKINMNKDIIKTQN
jgi:hypothetical protein